MLTLEQAQEKLIALAPVLNPASVKTHEALGRYLVHDLAAIRTQPSGDLSAMDGYAICGDGPWERVGESRAGMPFDGSLTRGQCARISTGAHIPTGADSVLLQEIAQVDGTLISLNEGEQVPPPSSHIRKTGFDFKAGQIVLAQGTYIGPAQIALAIAAGHHTLTVRELPKISILDSGDELVRPPAPCGLHQVPASNGPMIAAMLQTLVGIVDPIGPIADDADAIARAISETHDCQILITSGGASVGDHDLIQQALKDAGADLAFWKVAIKPGKPLLVATRRTSNGRQVIIGLPGNPVSSFVTCFLFVLPLLRAALGDSYPLPKPIEVRTGQALPAVGVRRELQRGIFDGHRVELAASQDSSALCSLATANCLIDRPAGSPRIEAGGIVSIYSLQNG